MKVFLSSTYKDLQQHRQAMLDTLMKMGDHISLVAMEHFGSDPTNPIQLSVRKVSESDVYIGVFGWCYGSIDQQSKMSITEIEYRTALGGRIPILLYLWSDEYAIEPGLIDTGRKAVRIRKLKKEISDRHTVQFFTTPEDLARRVVADLHRLLQSSLPKPQSDNAKIHKFISPEVNPAHPFLFCHWAQASRTKDRYNVSLYLDLFIKDEGVYIKEIKRIDRVIYQLHETFLLPVIAMQNWHEHFLLELMVWGEFWARATVLFKDNRPPVSILRYINLELPGSLDE